MRLMKHRRSRSAQDCFFDLALVPLGIWLVLDAMSIVSTVCFVLANIASLSVFRNPLRARAHVQGQPWEVPVALVFFSALFAGPAVHRIGLERTGLAVLNVTILVVARTLINIGTIQDRASVPAADGREAKRGQRTAPPLH